MDSAKEFDFEKVAITYSKHRYPNEKLLEHIFNRVRYADRILEVGCGTADYLSILSELLYAHGFGFDISPSMISEASKKNRRIELTTADANGPFPYRNFEFDFVFNINLVHYVTDLENLFKESFRVLQNDGSVLTVTDSCQDISERTLTNYFPETLDIDRGRYPGNSSIISAMKKAGFEGIYTTKVKTSFEFKKQHFEQYRNKAYSSLRLIAEERFEEGMKRLESDMERGLVLGKKAYTQIWGIKVAKRDFDLPMVYTTGFTE
ncbi:MAG: class I SAM-dependent methyltransferase [Kosmotogaceae bacterium]|nr:class I SAM-dependent methyltransferase [Kosmotogaceae bacterium]